MINKYDILSIFWSNSLFEFKLLQYKYSSFSIRTNMRAFGCSVSTKAYLYLIMDYNDILRRTRIFIIVLFNRYFYSKKILWHYLKNMISVYHNFLLTCTDKIVIYSQSISSLIQNWTIIHNHIKWFKDNPCRLNFHLTFKDLNVLE